jgi:uncharacterized cupin superfamily protein
MIHRRSCIVACFSGLFAAAGLMFAAERPEDAAQAAAESWLRLVDGGNYSASWEQAAKGLKGAVKQTEWSQTTGGVRAPLGKVVSRRLRSRQYRDKMPTTTRVIGGRVYTWGGTGQHVVVAFDTAFAKKASAAETVIVVKDTDGVWRVSEYLVR